VVWKKKMMKVTSNQTLRLSGCDIAFTSKTMGLFRTPLVDENILKGFCMDFPDSMKSRRFGTAARAGVMRHYCLGKHANARQYGNPQRR